MPLKKSASDFARSQNIATEIKSGRPPKQAEAIAYSEQRAAKKKGMSKGGIVKKATGRMRRG